MASALDANTPLGGGISGSGGFGGYGGILAALLRHHGGPQQAQAEPAMDESALARLLGLTSPDDQIATDPRYNTQLSPEQNEAFTDWKLANAPYDSGYDYDFKGAFKDGLTPDPNNRHWPDTYKKPNHETFSVESKYAPQAIERAGYWKGDTYNISPLDPVEHVRKRSPGGGALMGIGLGR